MVGSTDSGVRVAVAIRALASRLRVVAVVAKEPVAPQMARQGLLPRLLERRVTSPGRRRPMDQVAEVVPSTQRLAVPQDRQLQIGERAAVEVRVKPRD